MNQPGYVMTGAIQNSLYRVGGAAALLCAGMYFVALAVYVPAYRAGPPPASVLEWFALFQASPLTGLFFLGLADIVITILWGPMALALYAALRRSSPTWSLIATVFVFVGMAVFLATNTASAMLTLSRQYAAAASEAQRASLLAAGQALLAVTEGARMLPLTWLAGLVLSIVMLRSGTFNKWTAWVGILGMGFLTASAFCAGYATTGPMTPLLSALTAITYAGGGVLSLAWYIMVGARLLKQGQLPGKALPQQA